ncbi:MAG TPA: LytTR family DNA-binding domain-containing protein [Flavitalea sp.]|nr:LytTR family DNA-binding domain-containing protein [Flavitalea sp.]
MLKGDQATTLKCLIVDDEPMARDVIRRYIEKVTTLQIAGEFGNAIDAMVFLHNEPADLIFLDIRMPHLSGTEFVKSLRNIPKIIFTTAHKEYALDGFELDVVDYLLKPIRFERFLRAVNKAFPQKNMEFTELVAVDKKSSLGFIYIKSYRKMIKVMLDDILYIESAGDYLKVFTENTSFVTRQTISSLEAMLSGSEFIRIHRSYIVSIQKIASFTHETVEIGKKELPIGKFYLNGFLKSQKS